VKPHEEHELEKHTRDVARIRAIRGQQLRTDGAQSGEAKDLRRSRPLTPLSFPALARILPPGLCRVVRTEAHRAAGRGEAAERVRVPAATGYFTRCPCFTTISTRDSRAMWRSASPLTAMMSAYLPSVTLP